MGRKKSKRKPPPKMKQGKMDTKFNCPFCNHEKSCDVQIDYAEKRAVVTCRVCAETFQAREVNYLTSPIDVYTEWIDDCQELDDED